MMNNLLQPVQQPGQENKLYQVPADKRNKRLEEACAEFESLFIEKLFHEMKKSVPESGLLNGGIGEDMYMDLFYREVARSLSSGKGMGLGDMLYRALLPEAEGFAGS